MVEQVENLRIEPQFHLVIEWKPLGEVEIGPNEIRTANRVAPEISELAVTRSIAAKAGAGAGVYRRNESIGIQPLNCARLRNIRNRIVFV